jgi:hypothetical protein
LFSALESLSKPDSNEAIQALHTRTSKVLVDDESGISRYQITDQEVYKDGTIVSGISLSNSSEPIFEYCDPDVKWNKVLGTGPYWKMVGIVFIMILYVTMVYGPIAAFLVELFPTRIRYTSMSLPYHVGNGVFGGLTPFIATLLTTMHVSDTLVGLWYPIAVAALCFVIGALYIREHPSNAS